MTVEQRVMNAIKAFEGFSRERYLNCAQSIVKALADLTPVDSEVFVRIGTGFGGGFAGMGEACGALTGGIMLISAKFGVIGDEPEEVFRVQKDLCKRLVREYCEWFKLQNGASDCSDIIKMDTHSQEAMARYTDLKQAHAVPCYKVIEESVRKLVEILIR